MDRIYTQRKIVVGVLVGGVVAGGYLVWRTYKSLGKPKHASATIVVAVSVAFLSLGLLLTFDALPRFLVPTFQLGLTVGAIAAGLGEDISNWISSSRPTYGWANTLGISVLGMLITAALILVPEFLLAGPDPSVKHYGSLQHEVQYVATNISGPEIDSLAGALTSSGFFDEAQQKMIDAKKDGERYVLTLYCRESIRTSAEARKWFVELRDTVQSSFPNNRIVFELVIEYPENVVARLE